jgi:hypothetical protein
MIASRYKFSGKEYRPDPDVDIDNHTSEIQRRLFAEFSSVAAVDDTPDEIHYLTKDNAAWFTFHDSKPMYADAIKLTKQDRQAMTEFVVNVPWLMCLYVAELKREEGHQERIFDIIKAHSEATAEPFYAVADPYDLNRRTLSFDVRSEFLSFWEDGHKRPESWCDLTRKQIERFKSYGLQNFALPNSGHTEISQQWIYVPTTAKPDDKKIISTLLQEEDFDCEKSRTRH